MFLHWSANRFSTSLHMRVQTECFWVFLCGAVMSPGFLKATYGLSVWSLTRQWSVKERSCSWWLQGRGKVAAGGALHVFTSDSPITFELTAWRGWKERRRNNKNKSELLDQRRGGSLCGSTGKYVLGCVEFLWLNKKEDDHLKGQNLLYHTSRITKLLTGIYRFINYNYYPQSDVSGSAPKPKCVSCSIKWCKKYT